MWSESFACTCGHGFVVKNVGLPTPAARKALMAAHGSFRVVVLALPVDAGAFSTIAAALSLPLAEVTRALSKLPVSVWEGTTLEADLMDAAIAKSGATVKVERVGAGS